ncbi:MAG: GNAT family N-acetyltransferase [Betaproteobacteria bacterium]|nr:GNAT family N-acetyltransferase [Betaproteobacteria bacterium]
MSKVRIERLDPDSPVLVEACTTLLANAFADPLRYGLERLHRHLLDRDPVFYHQFFIATAAGQVIGVGGVKAADWASDTHILHLSAVAPERRGQGIGRALIAARIDWVESSFPRGRILVSTSRPRRYRDLGFTEIRASRIGGRQLMVKRFKAG